MKLYIAEKREVAKAINETFGGKLKDDLYELPNGDKVAWLSGHLMKLADPEHFDKRYESWDLADLPLNYPIKTLPLENKKDHLNGVIEAIKSADELVNCGDPDPEGQRLVDEVIEFSGVKKPVFRVLINDNNAPAIKKAVEKMESNDKYQGLSQSALARAVGDQRSGYKLTRAYTILARKMGVQKVLSVGRVQTPILGLVVRRDKQIEEHKSAFYYLVKADLEIKGNNFLANYQAVESDNLDEKKRLIDKARAEEITKSIENQQEQVLVKEVEIKNEEVAAPLPYNLLALQADAAAKFGFNPKKVLEITQNLRDKHKAITYNRSDCRYLNDERHAEAEDLLKALGKNYEIAEKAEPQRKSKAFNSKKVSAHHAIIPTQSVPENGSLSDEEQKIYDLIVNLYVAQFYPPRELKKVKATFEIAEHIFTATSAEEIKKGWREIISSEDEEEETINALADLSQGDKGEVKKAICDEKKTQPPKRYSMATLLKDLASVAKYVQDPKIKKLLLDKDADKADEKGGIGTPATRDSHIETLFTRGFVEEKGKQIISTDLGRQLIEALPEFATTPDMTALWHEKQKMIEAGEISIDDLLNEIDKAIKDEIQRVSNEGLKIKTDAPKCPNCESGYLQKRKSKNGEFWGCSNYPNCTTTFPDKKGKPDFEAKKSSGEKSNHQCPKCKKGFLIRRPSKKDPKKFWWGCSEYRNGCDFMAFDDNGKPKNE